MIELPEWVMGSDLNKFESRINWCTEKVTLTITYKGGKWVFQSGFAYDPITILGHVVAKLKLILASN